MKKILVILAIVVATAYVANGQTDVFPEYERSFINLAIDTDLESVLPFHDSTHMLCGHLMYYEFYGMLPLQDGHRWVDTEGGTLDADNTNSPGAVLCRLLKAYKNRSIPQMGVIPLGRRGDTRHHLCKPGTGFSRNPNHGDDNEI